MALWGKKMASDNVNRPAHYAFGKIEVIEALEDWGLDLHKANAVKYIARSGRKDASKEIEDLEKAIWYLNRKVHLLKSAQDLLPLIKPKDMNAIGV